MQDYGEGLRPIAFMSRTLSPTERKYSAYERELAAMAFCFVKWRHYLEGWWPLGVDTSSAVLVRPSFATVVSAPLGELISVQVGATGLAHCSYRSHLNILNGRGQG